MITEEIFLKDVAKHEMTVLMDNGLNRHLRFSNPESSCYYFDIITYKGGLLITGDCGAYVFQRVDDMFDFFTYANKSHTGIYINSSYWAEKVVAMDKKDKIEQFSAEKFNREVHEVFFTWVRDNKDTTDKDFRREVYDAIQDKIIDIDDNDLGSERLKAVSDFEMTDYKTKKEFRFYDFYERDFIEYSNRYIWNLFAIVWGIKKYLKEGGVK